MLRQSDSFVNRPRNESFGVFFYEAHEEELSPTVKRRKRKWVTDYYRV